MDFISLLSVGLAFFIVAASPGPANITNAALAMSQGRKVSLIYSLGLTVGLGVWGCIAVTGLGAVLETSVVVLMVLKVLGGLYLLWLGFLSAKSAFSSNSLLTSQTKAQERTYSKWFLKGLLLNLSNPKSVIAWIAALSVGVGPDANALTLLSGLLVCIFAGFFINVAYSLCFSISGVMAAYRSGRKLVDGAVAGLMGIAGIGLIRSAFSKSAV